MRLLLNGDAVESARLELPRTGAWSAEVRMVTPLQVVPGPCTLVLQGEAGTLTLRGTVTRSDAEDQRSSARVVGGSGGLRYPTAPIAWAAPTTLGSVLRALLGAVGETVDPTTTATLPLTRWTLPAVVATDALATLLRALPTGAAWRVEPSGGIRVAIDTWAPIVPLAPSFELDRDDTIGMRIWALEDPSIWPGRSLYGERIEHVAHIFDGNGCRTHVYVSTLAGGLQALRSTIASTVDTRALYLATYPARVVSQRPDGALDLIADDVRLPQLAGVPIRYGVPGVRATVRPGSRVELAFEAGDPSKPVATLWELASVVELSVVADRIKLGNAPTEFAALASRVDSALTALTAWCAAHTHASGGAPPSPIPPQASTVASASTQVSP